MKSDLLWHIVRKRKIGYNKWRSGERGEKGEKREKKGRKREKKGEKGRERVVDVTDPSLCDRSILVSGGKGVWALLSPVSFSARRLVGSICLWVPFVLGSICFSPYAPWSARPGVAQKGPPLGRAAPGEGEGGGLVKSSRLITVKSRIAFTRNS